jgi:hypothetical protein
MKTGQKSSAWRISFSLTLLIVLGFSALEAIMIKLSLERLSRRADVIIEGVVEDVSSEWSLDHSIIQTVVTLQVQDIAKGHLTDPRILIQFPGGEIGDIGLKVADMPTFQRNEKVLVFMRFLIKRPDPKYPQTVWQSPWPAFHILGGAQGKYSIDSHGMARRDGYELVPGETDPDAVLPLESLRQKIHQSLGRNEKVKR